MNSERKNIIIQVSDRYIKKPFDKFAETNGKWYWVWYSNYEVLD